MSPTVGRRIGVLGVGVDPLTVGELHAEIVRLVRGGGRGLVLNVNAHCLNLCYEDPKLRDFMNRAEVVFCEGAGVVLAQPLAARTMTGGVLFAAAVIMLNLPQRSDAPAVA